MHVHAKDQIPTLPSVVEAVGVGDEGVQLQFLPVGGLTRQLDGDVRDVEGCDLPALGGEEERVPSLPRSNIQGLAGRSAHDRRGQELIVWEVAALSSSKDLVPDFLRG